MKLDECVVSMCCYVRCHSCISVVHNSRPASHIRPAMSRHVTYEVQQEVRLFRADLYVLLCTPPITQYLNNLNLWSWKCKAKTNMAITLPIEDDTRVVPTASIGSGNVIHSYTFQSLLQKTQSIYLNFGSSGAFALLSLSRLPPMTFLLLWRWSKPSRTDCWWVATVGQNASHACSRPLLSACLAKLWSLRILWNLWNLEPCITLETLNV